jgi:hypothetical protein
VPPNPTTALAIQQPPSIPSGVVLSSLDRARMTADCILSTPRQDRQGDVLVPIGCELGDYVNNPVVFFDHQSYPFPIGLAENDAGVLHVKAMPNQVISRTFFDQSDPVAQQVYRMVDEKLLRGISVGFDPLPGCYEVIGRKRSPDGKVKSCYRFDRWVLLEYSHTPIGVNPDALTVMVQKGRVGGEAMHPAITKSLSRFTLARQWVPAGWHPERKAMNTDDLTPPPTDAADDTTDSKPLKPSAMAMLDGIQMARDHGSALGAATSQIEHEGASQTLQDAIAAIKDIEDTLVAAMKQYHPDVKVPGSNSVDMPADGEAAEETKAEPAKTDDEDDEDEDDKGGMVVKGYRPKRLRLIEPGKQATISPEDAAIITKSLERVERRFRQAKLSRR